MTPICGHPAYGNTRDRLILGGPAHGGVGGGSHGYKLLNGSLFRAVRILPAVCLVSVGILLVFASVNGLPDPAVPVLKFNLYPCDPPHAPFGFYVKKWGFYVADICMQGYLGEGGVAWVQHDRRSSVTIRVGIKYVRDSEGYPTIRFT